MRAAQFLKQVLNMQGGTLAWRAAGKPLVLGEHRAGKARAIPPVF
jgi:hypothetical protein